MGRPEAGITETSLKDRNKARGKETVRLVRLACELRNGGVTEEPFFGLADADIRAISFSMMPNGPLATGIIVNGTLFVSALDAAVMDRRDRNRMLAVARTVKQNG